MNDQNMLLSCFRKNTSAGNVNLVIGRGHSHAHIPESGGGRLEEPEVLQQRGERTLVSRDLRIPDIWSIFIHDFGYMVIGYMVISDTWSILAGPEADLVSGTHCTIQFIY